MPDAAASGLTLPFEPQPNQTSSSKLQPNTPDQTKNANQTRPLDATRREPRERRRPHRAAAEAGRARAGGGGRRGGRGRRRRRRGRVCVGGHRAGGPCVFGLFECGSQSSREPAMRLQPSNQPTNQPTNQSTDRRQILSGRSEKRQLGSRKGNNFSTATFGAAAANDDADYERAEQVGARSCVCLPLPAQTTGRQSSKLTCWLSKLPRQLTNQPIHPTRPPPTHQARRELEEARRKGGEGADAAREYWSKILPEAVEAFDAAVRDHAVAHQIRCTFPDNCIGRPALTPLLTQINRIPRTCQPISTNKSLTVNRTPTARRPPASPAPSWRASATARCCAATPRTPPGGRPRPRAARPTTTTARGASGGAAGTGTTTGATRTAARATTSLRAGGRRCGAAGGAGGEGRISFGLSRCVMRTSARVAS
jgi:hypothetical protein